MKKKLLVWTVASLLPIAVLAASVKISTTGPSSQGDLTYVATATSVTNMVMGTGGLYRVTFDPNYTITGLTGDGSALTGIVGPGSTVAPGYLWIGNAQSNSAAVALSGDVTVITNGTTTIGARKVVNTMLPEATDGQLLVGMSVGGSNVVARSITGNITIDSNGVSAVASLPAISGASLTALTAANISAGTLAGGVKASATNLNGNIPLASLTNSFEVGPVYSGTITNVGLGSTNTLVFKNGILMSVTLVPAP
jgi:hypothetical protein